MTQHDSQHTGNSVDSEGVEGSSTQAGESVEGTTKAPTRREIRLRGPAQLADALPYLLGFHPDDSIVVVALHGERGRFGGRLRIGISGNPGEWQALSTQVAECLAANARTRGRRPDGAVVFLCQEPVADETGHDVMERLRPLAQKLRVACGDRQMPVYEALCVSTGRYWSYCCPDPICCPSTGRPLAVPGTSAMAAAAAYAGLQVRGSLSEMRKRLEAVDSAFAERQKQALNSASATILPRMLSPADSAAVRTETLELAGKLMTRFLKLTPDADSSVSTADAHDDGLLSHQEAAVLIHGLQDRGTRDRAAEWMEGADAAPALRLWRAVARRCVPPFTEHAAAPLTLAGWVAWSGGDEPTARVALDKALRSDPEYVFAQLLHRACNDGLDPEPLRHCMREQRDACEERPGQATFGTHRRAAP